MMKSAIAITIIALFNLSVLTADKVSNHNLLETIPRLTQDKQFTTAFAEFNVHASTKKLLSEDHAENEVCLFVPNNNAFADFDQPIKRTTEDVLLMHVLKGCSIPAPGETKILNSYAVFNGVDQKVVLYATAEVVYVFLGKKEVAVLYHKEPVKCKNGVLFVIESVIPTAPDLVTTLNALRLYQDIQILDKYKYLTGLNANEPQFTVFIPKEGVWSEADFDTMAKSDVYTRIGMHLTGDLVYSNDFVDGKTVKMSTDQVFAFSRDAGGNEYVNGVKIIGKNFVLWNGVVHVIDGELKPYVPPPPPPNPPPNPIPDPIPDPAPNNKKDKSGSIKIVSVSAFTLAACTFFLALFNFY